MIDGVRVKDIVTHGDERGFFREMLRVEEDFPLADVGQLSHSLVNTGTLKAWHYHHKQSQWNYVACGEVQVALYDYRKDSPTFGQVMEMHFGDNQKPKAYFFPAGVLHGYQCLKGPMHIFYMTSGVYDLLDEGRLASDSMDIPYSWNKITGKDV
jgi:dTDP-4-dehydrorhamnose 3,5-epimerase